MFRLDLRIFSLGLEPLTEWFPIVMTDLAIELIYFALDRHAMTVPFVAIFG